MRRRRPAEAGLTLMEILVAVTLLGLLSAGILGALRIGAAAWETANASLALERRVALANAILYAALEGIAPVLAEFSGQPMAGSTTVVFFQGHPQSMRFVSAYSLEAGPRAGLRILELQVVEGPRGRRVLLNDLPYLGPRQAGRLILGVQYDPQSGQGRLAFAPIQPSPASFILADELQACTFAYYLEERGSEPPGRWLPVWDRVEELPSAVRIQIAAAPEQARLRPVSVTVPIRSRLRPL